MTRDDIINLALMGERSMKQRIEWAVNMEREECAKVAYDYTVKVSLPNFFESAEYVAAAIRARGQ